VTTIAAGLRLFDIEVAALDACPFVLVPQTNAVLCPGQHQPPDEKKLSIAVKPMLRARLGMILMPQLGQVVWPTDMVNDSPQLKHRRSVENTVSP
jgi:hypothetical protein